MNALWSNNFIIAFVRKHKVTVLISMVIIAIAYNDDDFIKKRAVPLSITEYLNSVDIMKLYGGDILEDLSKNPMVRPLCTIFRCQGDSAK